MKPAVRKGQRWMLGNYEGQTKYLLAEIEDCNGPYADVKVVQVFYDQSLWKLGAALDEENMTSSHWIYQEGQDKPAP